MMAMNMVSLGYRSLQRSNQGASYRASIVTRKFCFFSTRCLHNGASKALSVQAAQRVTVVGGGAAGLTSAYFAAIHGAEVLHRIINILFNCIIKFNFNRTYQDYAL